MGDAWDSSRPRGCTCGSTVRLPSSCGMLTASRRPLRRRCVSAKGCMTRSRRCSRTGSLVSRSVSVNWPKALTNHGRQRPTTKVSNARGNRTKAVMSSLYARVAGISNPTTGEHHQRSCKSRTDCSTCVAFASCFSIASALRARLRQTEWRGKLLSTNCVAALTRD